MLSWLHKNMPSTAKPHYFCHVYKVTTNVLITPLPSTVHLLVPDLKQKDLEAAPGGHH
jgi:hypothetical protein